MKMFAWVLTAMILVALPAAAKVRDAQATIDPGVAAWIESLMIPTQPNISCCGVADCHMVEDRVGTDGYQAFLVDRWVDVPMEAVLHKENKAGRAVLCIYQNRILCFVPGLEI